MSELLQGVLFVSSVSGLIYRNHNAAGDISCVIVKGKRFYPMEATKLTNAMHSDGQGDVAEDIWTNEDESAEIERQITEDARR